MLLPRGDLAVLAKLVSDIRMKAWLSFGVVSLPPRLGVLVLKWERNHRPGAACSRLLRGHHYHPTQAALKAGVQVCRIDFALVDVEGHLVGIDLIICIIFFWSSCREIIFGLLSSWVRRLRDVLGRPNVVPGAELGLKLLPRCSAPSLQTLLGGSGAI